ncbi:MAG: three-Cys-motif partner protein TcmP [Candidatus Abyssobacteria bacterium SURF_17]|uniref:Three-Cys-motif partner protein TcmP n=1 Tax=Candidatus Abyssobacteria bacterium SURF_17 TaxID=2093361 RepID=A0A419EVR4_9BACT|nr:MAG: three-Cys-motif partner protein TcmP [Candidatus Abyssubacteria bacterium SURF_17]
MTQTAFDEINYWSEVKLEIVRRYAEEYSKILSAQKRPALHHIYIDAFAGGGIHISKASGEFVPGSPLNALLIKHPFKEYHLIDLDSKKADSLREIVGNRPDVTIYEGDCNALLLDKVFPRAKWEDYRRALCLLDPYGLHLNWEVIFTAGQMRSIEIFLNFPIADMNRNVLRRDMKKVDPGQVARMNAFWGDESWREVAYDKTADLFGYEEKVRNEVMVKAFQDRLKNSADFEYVPDPMPMRNSKGSVVYYLFFASHNRIGEDIVTYIFRKYRNKGAL